MIKSISELIDTWGLDENAIVLEPQEEFNGGIIGITEDKKQIVYSYEKLTESLAHCYMENEKNEEKTYEDYLFDACEWVDYNTIRALEYCNKDYRPLIIYEV